MSEVTPYVEPAEEQAAPRTYTRREIFVRRVLFWAGILAFVLVASLPLLMFMLAVRGEITFNAPGDFPDDQVRVWMVMEPDERGVAYSLPGVVTDDGDRLQVETTVRYLLWEGENEVLRYCQTYTRPDSEGAWSMSATESEACSR